MNGPPSVHYEVEFDIPAEDIWPLIADFGGWGNWCPLFNNMRISNGKKPSEVGAIRKYKMLIGGSGYEEVLKEIDNTKYTLRYDNLSITPPIQGVTGVASTISLKAIDDKRTLVSRSSWLTAPALSPEVQATIKALQTKSYKGECEFLKVHAVAGRMISTGMGFFNDKLMLMTKALLTGQSQTWQYEEYPEQFGYLPRMVKGLPMSEVLPAHKIGQMITRFVELVYLQAKNYIVANLMPSQQPDNSDRFTKESEELVKMGFLKPQGLGELTDYLCNHWESDEEFCQQLLQGVNPLHIKAVRNLSEIPDIFNELTITERNGEKKSTKQLVDEKRLFMCDYRELAQYHWVGKARFYAPIVLVYRKITGDKESHLDVLGIQLDPSRSELFTPQMPQKNRYKLARMFVACADTQYHEFRYHLVIAHMGMEPICIATHNRLPKTHHLNALLAPHLEGTIGIAFFARQTLIAEENAFTDKTFALGTRQGLKLASDGWRKYDFYKSSFPEQLAARGFYEDGSDGVQNYLYRDDGFKLWHAFGDYARDVVHKFYHDDAAVLADGDLQMWADELASKDGGALPGFPSSIEKKDKLVHVLQIILWNASAQHSILNYPQTPYLNLVPNRPNTMFGEMPPLPADKKDLDDDYIKSCLAPELPMLFQLLFTWLLSLPADAHLLNLDALKTVYPEGSKRFHESMEKLSKELHARNEAFIAKGKAPYLYLLPENVANSVNI